MIIPTASRYPGLEFFSQTNHFGILDQVSFWPFGKAAIKYVSLESYLLIDDYIDY